jgi:hypothetical protein
MSEQIVPSHSAAFDLETPPGSATAATAEEGGHFSKELDNLATVSLDTPTASQVPPDSAFAVQAAGGTGQLDSAASGTDVSSANASTGGSLLATVTDSSLPPSLSLSGFTEPQESVNPLLTAGLSGLSTAAPASSSSEAPPDLPKASPVKVRVLGMLCLRLALNRRLANLEATIVLESNLSWWELCQQCAPHATCNTLQAYIPHIIFNLYEVCRTQTKAGD